MQKFKANYRPQDSREGSPRGAQTLTLAAKVRALLSGRYNVSFEDIRRVFLPAMRHRVILNFEAEAEGIDPDKILLEVLEREVAHTLGRPVSRKSLEGLLVRNPERFEVDAGGHWRRRVRVEEVEPEDPGPPPGRQPARPTERSGRRRSPPAGRPAAPRPGPPRRFPGRSRPTGRRR